MVKELDKPTYEIDPSVLKRFDERDTIFMRRFWDHAASFHGVEYRDLALERISSGESGYSRVEFARILASWTVHDCFGGAFSWERLGQADTSMMQFDRYEADPAEMTAEIKQTARLFGADLVGICEVDDQWIYSHDRSGDLIELPPECTHAIVMAIVMDKEGVATSPEYASAVSTGVGYSKMAFAIASLSAFLRNLRYKALPMGNDTALSIPLAIDAGLGQLGRNGLLVTPEHGPCVRLCKVLTDMPLVADQPIDFGLPVFCRTCDRCSEACQADAISSDADPSFDVACPSNNPGIRRWPVDADRCYEFWAENTAACSNCISSCPFSKIG
ncbi:reductive dehalogenase [Candidatus Bipolaricaulota bacterium]